MSGKKINVLVSVQTKIIFITLLIITLVLGAFAWYEISRRHALLDQELKELARVTVIKLKNNLRIPLWDLDIELVADTIGSEMLTRDISGILIYDSNGKDLLTGKQRDVNWEVADINNGVYQPIGGGEQMARDAYIENRNERIGKVVVYVDNRFHQQELYSSIQGLLITLFMLDLTILLVLWLVMQNLVRRPMEVLSEAAKQLSLGNFNVQVDAERKDEIGVVADSIDRMKTSLRMAIERLRKMERKKRQVRSATSNV